jgi:hypothetical protein
VVSFFKYRQCLITAPVVLTRIYALVHQVRVYAFSVLTTAFSALTTRLRSWCTPEALTNQGGRTHQYIDHVVCFNTRTSHHLYKHTILHVFRARRYDLIVPLSWYK